MKHLNENFRRQNADTLETPTAFLPFSGDSKIEFRLANIDPNGNCTDGIVRTYSDIINLYTTDTIELWDDKSYLNIFVAKSLVVPNNFQAGGVGTFPWSDWLPFKGIGVTAKSVKSENEFLANEDLITHEVGHWLDLYHVFASDGCDDDDFVDDTPIQLEPNFGCPEYPQFSCDSILGDMFSNYMDYTNCTNMFTTGQIERMWGALNSDVGGRNNLWTANNLILTGTDIEDENPTCGQIPIADFGHGQFFEYYCHPANVPFWDASWRGKATSWKWHFENGTPSISTEEKPIISYESSGNYSVTLIASNDFGSDTISRDIDILVLPPSPYYLPSNLKEDFENNDNLEDKFYIFDQDNKAKWELTSQAGFNSSKSAYINYHLFGAAGSGSAP